MARYVPETEWSLAQPKVLEGFLRAVEGLRPPPRLELALWEAGIVESHLQDLAGGDLDSVGVLQQRKGWGPIAARRDPYLSALAFLREGVLTNRAALRDAKTAGQLAQAIQRSAFPDRYDQAEAAARYVMARAKGEIIVAWHLAPSLKALFAEVDARWPKRDKSSDGTLGDAAHASRASEHNPDHDADPMPTGAVSAADITKDSAAMIEAVRKALVADDRTWYVIHDGHIWSRTHGFEKRPYTGTNPHRGHLHVSLRQTKAAHDDTSSWGIRRTTDKPAEPVEPTKAPPTLRRGSNPDAELVATLQRFLGVRESGFAERTRQAVLRYQRTHGLKADGIVGPETWAVILTALKLPGYSA